MDQDEFEEICEEYWTYVYTICTAYLNNREDALDATQEVFIRKTTRLDQYDSSRGPYKAYLARNAVNHCIDRLRSLRTHPPAVDITNLTAPPTTLGPEVYNQDLTRCLALLDPMSRKMFLMKHLEGYTWTEIAKDLEVTIHAARKGVAEAEELLRKCLEKE